MAGALDGKSPAIYYIESGPTQNDIIRAAEMGFNTLGLSELPGENAAAVTQEAAAAGLSVMLDLDLAVVGRQVALLAAHPDWFVEATGGARFVYLAETDPVVDWWNGELQRLQAAGVGAFRCLNIAAVPRAIWLRLIQAAKMRQASTRFCAWTPGLPVEAIEEASSIGFDFSFSSSCWWDFKLGWLNEDARRMELVGPAIALVTPPNNAWAVSAIERRRSLILAATYGAGWLLPAGYEGTDLRDDVTKLNRLRATHPAFQHAETARVISSNGATVAALRRGAGFVTMINASLSRRADVPVSSLAPRLGGQLRWLGEDRVLGGSVTLSGGEASLCEIVTAEPITSSKRLPVDCDAPRLAVEAVTPKVDDGQFPVRRVVGETVTVEADIIGDGHDKLAAELVWRPLDESKWRRAPMKLVSNDRWRGQFALERLGRHVFAIIAWKDNYATLVDEITKKHNAGIQTHLEIEEALALIRETLRAAGEKGGKALKAVMKRLDGADVDTKRSIILGEDATRLMRAADLRKFAVQSGDVIVDAERLAARFANWYEIFPRSQSGDASRHGTFRDVIRQLPRIAEMGFDVLYFPPIHPIGRINRKGRNNTLTPSPDDPGSPYAIGSTEGGHDAIHPELGTVEDFLALRDAAAEHGIELALDFAVQCAPDHPWLREHKDWFDWRPDGSIRYAENPPKKYEDIVNVDFYAEGAKPALWKALRDIVQHWVDLGVRLFRVDNPHTKPLPFWEWLIADIRRRHPDTIFLAEAFTRPKVMYRLAKIGFSQSYTYFTWRNTKAELAEYLTELNQTAPKDFFRPHFFVNTPDINPIFLQTSGRGGFLIRAALAATLSGLWGVYNGFELCEATPVAPGKEEYLDSEKYQIRVWDYDRPGNIVPEITRLNAIRRSNAALQSHLGIEFHNAYDDNVLFFSKSASDGNVILVAVTLDPFARKEVRIEVPLWLFGLPDDAAIEAEDLMRSFQFIWRGKNQTVTLHPESPFCIWRISPIVS
jgi:starch synthase (maltosyl-transferring)